MTTQPRSQPAIDTAIRDRALHAAFEQSPCATALLDRHGRITEVNPALIVLLGRPASELLGRTPQSFLESAGPHADGDLPLQLRHGRTVYRCYRHPGGHVLALQASLSPSCEGSRPRPGLLHLVDLTMVRGLSEQLERVEQIDRLTGLPNREALLDALARRLADQGAAPFVVGHLDLARFGLVNDALGRAAADQVLAEVGRRLADDPAVDLVARVGSDEFVAVATPPAGRSGSRRLVEMLLDAVAVPMALGEHRVVLSARVGLARSADVDGAEDLLGRAEAAVHEAKRTEVPAALWHPATRDRAQQRLGIEGALRQADLDAEMVLHYQPVLDLTTGTVGSVEALVRWQHPTLGLIPPDRFLPVVADLGKTVELGDWVLRRATADLRRWRCRHQGAPKVAVNLSGEHVGDPVLVDTVRHALDRSGAEPTMLVVEITEQALVTASPPVLRRLHRLADAGVEIHLDDFGTGYSSLAYLNRLPVHGLKVDRQFVSGGTGLLLLRTIARLGRELGKDVVAEGVETAAQLQAVRAAGCTAAQGYLLGRPTGDLDAALARRPAPALA